LPSIRSGNLLTPTSTTFLIEAILMSLMQKCQMLRWTFSSFYSRMREPTRSEIPLTPAPDAAS
jgi:hypothetical protein